MRTKVEDSSELRYDGTAIDRWGRFELELEICESGEVAPYNTRIVKLRGDGVHGPFAASCLEGGHR